MCSAPLEDVHLKTFVFLMCLLVVWRFIGVCSYGEGSVEVVKTKPCPGISFLTLKPKLKSVLIPVFPKKIGTVVPQDLGADPNNGINTTYPGERDKRHSWDVP